eukprot:2634690-Rhodomonas_salina.1
MLSASLTPGFLSSSKVANCVVGIADVWHEATGSERKCSGAGECRGPVGSNGMGLCRMLKDVCVSSADTG